MKKILFFILCNLSIWTLQAGKKEMNAVFEKGNEAYSKANYTKAILLYESILGKGYENIPLYYNLGNAYFKKSVYGKSILNYERALRLNPSDESVKMNYQIANSKLVDKIEEIPPSLVKKWWLSLVESFSLNTWAVILLVLLSLSCATLGYFLTHSDYIKRRIIFYTLVALSGLLILSVVCAGKSYQIRFAKNEAIIMDAFVQAKSSPTEIGIDKFVVHEGVKVLVEGSLNNWTKIKLSDGTIGWIPQNSLEII